MSRGSILFIIKLPFESLAKLRYRDWKNGVPFNHIHSFETFSDRQWEPLLWTQRAGNVKEERRPLAPLLPSTTEGFSELATANKSGCGLSSPTWD